MQDVASVILLHKVKALNWEIDPFRPHNLVN